jgi:hypothetical protein
LAHIPVKIDPENPQAPATYQQVKLINFRFLGKEFETADYAGFTVEGVVQDGPFKVAGVGQELMDLLVEAQENHIFQNYAAFAASRNQPVTEDGFIKHCGVFGLHKGYQPRDGKHKRGVAIDIDATFNPYAVTGVQNGVMGGETPSNFKTGGATPPNIKKLNDLRSAALKAYERAVKFTFGGSATFDALAKDQGTETSGELWDRFNRIHEALVLYMNCGFTRFLVKTKKGPQATNSIPKNAKVLPRAPEDIAKAIKERAGDFRGGDAPQRVNDAAFIAKTETEVIEDHQAMRNVCVYGSWQIENQVQVRGPSRDPTFGIMTLRRHVAQGLVDARSNGMKLRWGASHFGAAESGDIMHFDLGRFTDQAATSEVPSKGLIYK